MSPSPFLVAQHFENGGVFIYWCAGARELPKVPPKDWGCSPPVLLSDTRILVGGGEGTEAHETHSTQLLPLIFFRPPPLPSPPLSSPQDVLIQNSDRHEGHFLWAEHWAKGSYTGGRVAHDAWRGRRHPVLIDQVRFVYFVGGEGREGRGAGVRERKGE